MRDTNERVFDAAGFLYIGDPHASSRKPGGRLDADFTATVCKKLEQAFAIANRHNLLPVITGDLLNRSRGDDERLLTLLLRAFKTSNLKPCVLVANHDVHDETEDTVITDDTTMANLVESGVLIPFEHAGEKLTIRHAGKKSTVVFYPYGTGLPKDLRAEREDADFLSIVSHHDLAFEGAYPGALELFEIEGCDLWVNGHMHLTKPPIQHGMTTCFNIGNITRQSKDTIAHIPSVWSWTFAEVDGTDAKLTPIPLDFIREVFDMTGIRVKSDEKGASVESTSHFVDLMRAQSNLDATRTEDASALKTEAEAVMTERNVSDGARNIMNSLLSMLNDAENKENVNANP